MRLLKQFIYFCKMQSQFKLLWASRKDRLRIVHDFLVNYISKQTSLVSVRVRVRLRCVRVAAIRNDIYAN